MNKIENRTVNCFPKKMWNFKIENKIYIERSGNSPIIQWRYA